MSYFWRIILGILVFMMAIGTCAIYYKYQKLKGQFIERSFYNYNNLSEESIFKKLEYSYCFIGKIFPKNTITDIVNNNEIIVNTTNNYKLILLFSNIDCQPCLKDALIIISEFYNKYHSYLYLNLIAIAKTDNVAEILKWKKVVNMKFPIYYDKDDTIFQKISLIKLPIIFLIDSKNNIILSLYIDQQTLMLLPSFLMGALKIIQNN